MTTEERLERLEVGQQQLEIGQNKLQDTVQQILQRLDKLDSDLRENNVRIEAYQKSSQQVVNLAFGLLSVAALAIIVPAIVEKL